MTIYPITIHGRKRWRLDRSVNGVRKVSTYPTKAAAEAAYRDTEASQSAAGEWWLSLSSTERLELVVVADEVRRSGLTLRQVWDEWRAQSKAPGLELRPVGKVIDEALVAKAAAGRRGRYVDNLGVVWRAFARGREALPVSALATRDVEEWLARPISLSTRASQLSRLSTLFEFAIRRGYAGVNPCDRIEIPSQQPKPPEILTVRQCARVMVYVRRHHPRALAWFTLALFAGIRPEECDRLTWEDVDLREGVVRVDAAASKMRQRRIVHLLPVAARWLEVARDAGADMPMTHMSRRRALRAVRDRLGFARWPQDVLRHTAASMMLALRQDAAAVALELGNSPAILFRHYRELVPRAEAERWARLIPKR